MISISQVNKYAKENDLDPWTKREVAQAVRVMNKLRLWKWFRTYKPAKGYLLDPHPKLDLLRRKIKGHSGASFAIVMNNLSKMVHTNANERRIS